MSRVMKYSMLSTLGIAVMASPALALDVRVVDPPYSAVGDGATNDRPAIQRAIDDVAAAGGGTVTLPGGRTYLTGNLTLASGVTLEIATGAVVVQSQTIADYANAPVRGRAIPNAGVPFVTYLDQNYPLIYAGNASNVHIRGGGKIQMTRGGDDPQSIIVHAIGLHLVTEYSITGITIAGASAYNLAIRNTSHGEIANVTTIEPSTLNSDGISLMNSSHLKVHDNQLTTLDDGIYIWASYDDPRRSMWWNSDTPRPSTDIEVYDNVVDNQATNGSHGFLFINWTGAAPDQSQCEISRINVHDNTFRASFPVGALNHDLYHAQGQKTPSKWLAFHRNTLVVVPNSDGAVSVDLPGMATADFSGDDPAYNFSVSSYETGLYNSDFDGRNAFSSEVGTSFWSVEGGGHAASAAVGQPGGRYGEITGFDQGYASISQGVYLAAGDYQFTLSTQSSGANIRMFAIQAEPLTITASLRFSNTSWQTQSLTFTVGTPGNYRLGIDNAGAGSGAADFARIDAASLVKLN